LSANVGYGWQNIDLKLDHVYTRTHTHTYIDFASKRTYAHVCLLQWHSMAVRCWVWCNFPQCHRTFLPPTRTTTCFQTSLLQTNEMAYLQTHTLVASLAPSQ